MSKRTVRCEHSSDISKCPVCFPKFTGLDSHTRNVNVAGIKGQGQTVTPTNKDFDAFLDETINTLINQIEWSVQVPGSPGIDRDKQSKAKAEAKSRITGELKKQANQDICDALDAMLVDGAHIHWNGKVYEITEQKGTL